MRNALWKNTLQSRPRRAWLCVASAFLILLVILLAGMVLFPTHVTVAPFTYDASRGSVLLRPLVAGDTRALEFDTRLTRTALGRVVYDPLVHAEIGIDQMNPSADFALGSYSTRLFYDPIDEAALGPASEGILGVDMFTPSPGFLGENVRKGARVTLDFKTNLCKIEDGPKLEPLHLPKGTVQASLLRDGDGPFYLLLPLNDGIRYRFALGIGTRDVILPTGSVLYPSRDAQGYVNAIGVVPVTLTLGGQDLSVQAIAPRAPQSVGVLGMSLLANYRVILDFRNRRLYLEPSNSPSDF